MNLLLRATNRHRIVTQPAQTRAPAHGIVDHEGGGKFHPTLGGGCGGLARVGAAPEGVRR
jgi:hypothetical protein